METSNTFPKEPNTANIEGLTQNLDSLSVKNDSPTKKCIPFMKYGHCKFDRNCKFVHQQNFSKSEVSKYKGSTTRNFKSVSLQKDPGVIHQSVGNEKLHDSRASSSRQNNSEKLCKYFLAGRCSKENCNFKHKLLHPYASKSSANSNSILPLSKTKKKSVPLCYYFKRGECLNGDNCKFYHPGKASHSNETLPVTEKRCIAKSVTESSNYSQESPNKSDIEKQNANFSSNIPAVTEIECITSREIPRDESDSNNSKCELSHDIPCLKERNGNCPTKVSSSVSIREYKTPCQVLKLFDLPLSENEISILRETEITQLRKRYPGCTESKTNTIFSIEFIPSDPDWVHNVTIFHLQIEFPDNYPEEICKIEVLQSSDFILEHVLRHLNKCISKWLHERHKHLMEMKKVELLFRSFLRWFDKNLNAMFSSCFSKKNDSSEEANTPCEENNTENKTCTIEKQLTNTPENHLQISGSTKTTATSSYKAQKNGFQLSLTGLELVEGVGTLSCTKLDITLLCRRCKTSVHVSTTPKKNKSMICSKCSLVMECNFEPSIIHQFTNVLGTVYLVGCTGLDINLVECAFLVDCLNCSKQVPIEGLHPGSKQKFWCLLCHQKFFLSVQSSKFQASSVAYTSVKSEPAKKLEKKKDVQIKEGAPLPEFGSCKHYKKSNRWFRFPCCGRIYPCDICHEEKEDGHEIKFASRIICGFCSKEQPFTKDKPCTGCSAQITAKSASHWEGGKGCRNKILMSRGDKKKYSGISKTVPKNSQVLCHKKKS